MATTAIPTIAGWGKRHGEKGKRADFADANREAILADCQKMWLNAVEEKWHMGRLTIKGLINRWRMAGYEIPELRSHANLNLVQVARSLYTPKDMGCKKATNFLGTQSHCLECPFDDC